MRPRRRSLRAAQRRRKASLTVQPEALVRPCSAPRFSRNGLSRHPSSSAGVVVPLTLRYPCFAAVRPVHPCTGVRRHAAHPCPRPAIGESGARAELAFRNLIRGLFRFRCRVLQQGATPAVDRFDFDWLPLLTIFVCSSIHPPLMCELLSGHHRQRASSAIGFRGISSFIDRPARFPSYSYILRILPCCGPARPSVAVRSRRHPDIESGCILGSEFVELDSSNHVLDGQRVPDAVLQYGCTPRRPAKCPAVTGPAGRAASMIDSRSAVH
jgi:hypothetical protein